MQHIEDFKKNWGQYHTASGSGTMDKASLQKIVKSRIKNQKSVVMKYFWASLTLQIIVYALLSHMMVKYWADTPVLLVSIAGVLLYLPFTVMLLRKYKRMAVLRLRDQHYAGAPMQQYILQQHTLLAGFYRFKRVYELILIPLSSAMLIWIFFRLYLPGGVMAYPTAALLCFLLTLASCAAAIIAENKRNFKEPLKQYEEILQDLKS